MSTLENTSITPSSRGNYFSYLAKEPYNNVKFVEILFI